MSIVGLDIGTTGCKSIVFDEEGAILSRSSREYFIDTPRPGWAEQDAESVFQLALETLAEAVSPVKTHDPPRAVSLSVQGEAIIPVDRGGHPLRRAILGMDTRTVDENRWLDERFGKEELFTRTGMPLHTINTLPKLLWIQKHEPPVWNKTYQFLLYEDFMIRRLGGRAFISHCLASRTQLYDLRTSGWAEDLLESCGIETSRLASLSPEKPSVVGTLQHDILEKLGLTHEVEIVNGGHDQACAALGSGVIQPGTAMVSTGTAEVVEAAMETPSLNAALREGNISIYKHVVPGLYLAMTLNHSGGLLLRWFRDSFCEKQIETGREQGRDPYQLLLEDAPDGPTSLMVLPHFAGSGTPWLDTESKGAIVGLSFSDRRSTVAKAILEGLTFELRVNLDLLKTSGIPVRVLHAVGGGAKSDLWLQLKSDICDIPLQKPKVTEAACLGAALLAGTAIGLYSDLPGAVQQAVRMQEQFIPRPDQVKLYDQRFQLYRRIYPVLKPILHSL